MKTAKVIFLSLTISLLFSVFALAQDNHKSHNTTKKTETVRETEGCGETSGSCCGSTQKASALNTPWNKVCPVMGNEVDPDVKTVEYKGKQYGFCCNGCDDKFVKDPAAYSRNLNKDGTRFLKSKS